MGANFYCAPDWELVSQIRIIANVADDFGETVPITAPGQVYVSQEFAALCAVEGTVGMSFEYLGRVPTAKKYGEAPLYRLDRDHARKTS